jgi:hypothetical protein
MKKIHWRLAMEQRRDPRRGLPLAKKRKVRQAERDALQQAAQDLDSGNPQEPRTSE